MSRKVFKRKGSYDVSWCIRLEKNIDDGGHFYWSENNGYTSEEWTSSNNERN